MGRVIGEHGHRPVPVPEADQLEDRVDDTLGKSTDHRVFRGRVADIPDLAVGPRIRRLDATSLTLP